MNRKGLDHLVQACLEEGKNKLEKREMKEKREKCEVESRRFASTSAYLATHFGALNMWVFKE